MIGDDRRNGILVVEDEAIVALDLKAELESRGYAVVGPADTGDKALALARNERPDLALVDVKLKGAMDGVELAQAFKRELDLPVIYLTSYSDAAMVQRAAQTTPYGYLTKPFQAKELQAAIDIALYKSSIERQLRASEERFRQAFDHAPLGMAIIAPTGSYVEINDALVRLLGLEGTNREGLQHRDVSLMEELPAEQERLNELIAGHEPFVQFEKRYRRAVAPETVSTLVSVSLLPRGSGPMAYLYQVLDITAQKKSAEQEAIIQVERARALAAEMATQAKNVFLSRMSHELRTPLNAMMGFAQLLKVRCMDSVPGASSYIDHILRAGIHLVALIEDVLDLQRIITGNLALNRVHTRLKTHVDDALTLLGPLASERTVVFQCDVLGSVEVLADEVRLRQVLLNIGSNAIKYNRPGGTVTWHAEPLPSGRLALRVRDTGPGMSAEALGRLFRPFERLGQERTSTPGTGLGLLIARGLMEDMGGSLSVESTPDVGTTVTLEFVTPGSEGVA
jgi:PAS domain S-box-containing protein